MILVQCPISLSEILISLSKKLKLKKLNTTTAHGMLMKGYLHHLH